jgi:hypothetical protein
MGSDCMQTTDCQQGLFCVQQPMGPSICSANFASIVATEEAGGEDAAQTTPPAADGAPAGDGGASPPAEAGSSPDVKAAPPDTGTPKEAQAPEEASPREASPPPDVSRAPGPDASGDDAGD